MQGWVDAWTTGTDEFRIGAFAGDEVGGLDEVGLEVDFGEGDEGNDQSAEEGFEGEEE